MTDNTQSLEDRMVEQVHKCIYDGEYVKLGVDTQGNTVPYCTYFFLEAGHEPVSCGFMGERIEIVRDCALGNVRLEFYKCNRWRK